ncbi:MAG: Glyoxalase/bleomycin resistance protein/dioxygenase [Frankiales bacterium]|nr:Glyoxalase/bleomycin resistance protein/dioxygenase [Frankiales bacterium]
MKLELVVVPVSDVDRAKAFYADACGWHVDVDHSAGEDFRVVQLSPPGSSCAIALMRNDAAGSVSGLHLVVEDLAAAREELLGRGVPVQEPHHFGATGQAPGLHPERASYASFAPFSDPDGNGWLLQEVHRQG